jgi:hypothetical protein
MAHTSLAALTDNAHDSENVGVHQHCSLGFGRRDVLGAVVGFEPIHQHFQFGWIDTGRAARAA